MVYMKHVKAAVILALASLIATSPLPIASAQQSQSETVAKPKKKDAPAEPDQPKIPTEFKKDKEVPIGLPTFRSDVNAVQLEVAVLDNKGHFIPGIPKGNFRILEDNVPQLVTNFAANAEAPMTIAL